jgi:membrane-associated phospholipid phosphatase
MALKYLKYVSNLLSAPVVALVVPVLFASTVVDALVGVLFIGVLPMVPWAYSYKQGRTDFDVSVREERTKMFIWALVMYVASALLFLDKPLMFALSCVYFFSTLVVALVNLKWKISVHCSGMAGPVTAIVYVFGLWLMPLYFLVLFVMWLRLRLDAHTHAQVVAGAVEGVLVTGVVYLLLL